MSLVNMFPGLIERSQSDLGQRSNHILSRKLIWYTVAAGAYYGLLVAVASFPIVNHWFNRIIVHTCDPGQETKEGTARPLRKIV